MSQMVSKFVFHFVVIACVYLEECICPNRGKIIWFVDISGDQEPDDKMTNRDKYRILGALHRKLQIYADSM